VERLEDYCAAKGYQVTQVVDRLTRVGYRHWEPLLELQDRSIEVVNLADNLLEDLQLGSMGSDEPNGKRKQW
jgi:predicted site-specific integrase-resolvase